MTPCLVKIQRYLCLYLSTHIQYLASVTMILTLQLVASVFAIVFHQPMKEVLRDELMLRTRTQYHPNSSFATAWDVVQTNVKALTL